MIITPGQFAFAVTVVSVFQENTLCTHAGLSVWNPGTAEIRVGITMVFSETNISLFPREYIG